VEMPDNSEADKAIKALNGKEVKGREIKVNQAKPRGDRPSRKRRY
jgi:RNA recognition motif-containing protein